MLDIHHHHHPHHYYYYYYYYVLCINLKLLLITKSCFLVIFCQICCETSLPCPKWLSKNVVVWQADGAIKAGCVTRSSDLNMNPNASFQQTPILHLIFFFIMQQFNGNILIRENGCSSTNKLYKFCERINRINGQQQHSVKHFG